MPTSKKRKKKGPKPLDPAQRAQLPPSKKKWSTQQILIVVFSTLIIVAMATSLIVSGLTPAYQPPVEDPSFEEGETVSPDSNENSDQPADENSEEPVSE